MNKPEPMTDKEVDAFIEANLRIYWRYNAGEQDSLRQCFRAMEAEVRRRWEQMLAAQEPVAWAMQRDDGLVLDVICPMEHDSYEGGYTVPLYAAPQPAQNHTALLEQALEALVFHRDNDMQGMYEIYEFIRKRNSAITVLEEALK